MNSIFAVLLWQVLLLGAPGVIWSFAFGLHSDLTYLSTLPGALVVLWAAFRRRVPRFAFAAAGTLQVLGLVIVFEYHRRSNMDLNAALVLETGLDAAATIGRSLTVAGLVQAGGLIAGAALTAYGFYLYALDLGVRAIRRSPPVRPLPVAAVLLVIAVLFVRSGWAFYRDVRDLRAAVGSLVARVPAPPPPGARESVIVLHLESVNAGAMFERTSDGFRWRAPFPGLRRLWQDGKGVLYPFFWSNTFATNRGIESLLCGVTGNLGSDKRPPGPCLPAILRERGYRTPYYYSYFDTEFYDFRSFLPALGFSNIIYGPELMRADDRRFNWGYDDCTFYDRVGEKLAADDGTPFFAYVEVSMHHAPFDGERRYPDSWPLPTPAGRRELYVNSLSEQDHCLPRFAAAVRRLKKQPHVFVVGDHSVPILDGFDLEDRFMTTLLYLPPGGRVARAVATDAPPSQADLYATIIDLLYAKTSPNSFAAALRGEADEAPRCNVLANQYGVLAFARADVRARYALDERRATIERRAPDGRWQAEGEAISFPGFLDKYACAAD